ncbi:two-component sensor histidine kinase [Azospira sp. I13]|uniref:sensor histidine kinase n=1 Tax=Azospira sp. I13 TaxID=1765050 RepID=UPI000D3F1BAA|nr:ATP-binding protein [Azospira sp. I13]GBG03199.1 two-component sensor histidine kinase [Azospira sp. I13]
MRALLVVAAALGGILLFLLASASANTALFARNYPWLLVLNGLVALALASLVGWQLRALWREHRAKVFGSRLKLRLLVFFALMGVVPGVTIYAISVQFVTKSIESWFDVRVEKALESGLNLGRSALDAMLSDLTEKGRQMAQELADRPDGSRRLLLNRLRDQAGVESAALFAANGQVIANANGDYSALLPSLPSSTQLKQARLSRGLASIEGEGQEMVLKVLVAVHGYGLTEEPRILQLTQSVPSAIADNADAVQEVYRDYQELSLARQGLTQIYALTLTLALLLSLFTAIAVAYFLARRLSAPLSILAEGTQAVAAGDFTPRQAIYSRDELGVLTQSFSQMTRQLDEARRDTERHRSELESARAYLEEILANLSAGVLAFDQRFVLRAANAGAAAIVGDDFVGLAGEPVEAWPRQNLLGRAIRDGFAAHPEEDWQAQIELERPGLPPQVLLLRGSKLPAGSGGGYVVVFDEVTQLIAAQRSAAWGEVARRLAHEIKNPLTPIQLSAERLQMKLEAKLDTAGAETLNKGTQTIINQVQAMKRMVDDFRDYARMPAPELAVLDLNALVGEVLGLYETSHASIDVHLAGDLPPVLGDATQLRQIIHNLLRNAEDALADQPAPDIRIATELSGRFARLVVEDNGPGFPAEILARAFEPYVTTKPKGTGLGLAIVRKIVDEHGGRIDITNKHDNEAGGGAQISIRLPLAVQQTSED